MPRIFKLLILLLFVSAGSIVAVLTTIARTSGISQQEQGEPLPKGKWDVIIVFDYKQHYDFSVPVELTRGTLTNEENKSGLSGVIIKNRTSKDISAITVSYFLTTSEDRETILYQGPPLEIVSKRAKENPTLPANQRRTFNVKNGNYSKMLKPLVKNGELNGKFVITLKISQVVFGDGSAWKENDTVSYKHPLFSRSPPQQTTCPYELCGYQVDSQGNPTGLLVCGHSDNPFESYWCNVDPINKGEFNL